MKNLPEIWLNFSGRSFQGNNDRNPGLSQSNEMEKSRLSLITYPISLIPEGFDVFDPPAISDK